MFYKSIAASVASSSIAFALGLAFALSLALALLAPPAVCDDAVLANGFQLRVERKEEMESAIRLYLKGGGYVDVQPGELLRYEREPAPVPLPVAIDTAEPATATDIPSLLSDAGHRQGLDPDLLKSMIAEESAFNASAVSPKGARGLMQLMPQTATDLGVSNAFHPGENVYGGALYIRGLIDRYQGDLAKALAAYNAGPAAVDRFGGIPPYKETQTYVRRVIARFNREKTKK